MLKKNVLGDLATLTRGLGASVLRPTALCWAILITVSWMACSYVMPTCISTTAAPPGGLTKIVQMNPTFDFDQNDSLLLA